MKINDFAHICKPAFVAMLGVQENFKEYTTEYTINESICSSTGCPFYTLKQDTNCSAAELNSINSRCCENCTTAITRTIKTTYQNERNRFKINNNQKRLSKAQLKQFLLYHFYINDNNGIALNISEKEVANILGCSIKTVRNNNEALTEYYYINVSYGFTGQFSVLIRDYKNRFLTAQEGGRGFLTITRHTLDTLLKIDNVNELRAQLRLLLEADECKTSDETQTLSISYKSLKRKLPNYLYKKAIKHLLGGKSQEKGLFNIDPQEEVVLFSIKDAHQPGKALSLIKELYKNKFTSYAQDCGLQLEDKTEVDLIQLSMQYSFIRVQAVLQSITERILEGKVENIGGYIRDLLEKHVDNIPTKINSLIG